MMKAVDRGSTAFFMTLLFRFGIALKSVGSLIGMCLLFYGCTPETPEFTLNWKDGKAISLNIPPPLANDAEIIQVTLGVDGAVPMLGEFIQEENQSLFIPLVPFTRGMHYHVLLSGKIIGEVNVPLDVNAKNPELSIYPSADTLPENLLKMYFVFTEPMVEGQSLQHIHLLSNQGDTLNGTFLDLQPELWNTESTMLTLWLDPGRIKRDLIPNKTMGNPLIKGETYTLLVSGKWKSKAGLMMQQPYLKNLVVLNRDEQIPNVDHWRLIVPATGTASALLINFPEAMDYSLIQSTIQVLDNQEKIIQGQIQVLENEEEIAFKPWDAWVAGRYRLRVESRLEDLAGNNLSRPFDQDLKKATQSKEKEFYDREFVIR